MAENKKKQHLTNINSFLNYKHKLCSDKDMGINMFLSYWGILFFVWQTTLYILTDSQITSRSSKEDHIATKTFNSIWICIQRYLRRQWRRRSICRQRVAGAPDTRTPEWRDHMKRRLKMGSLSSPRPCTPSTERWGWGHRRRMKKELDPGS
jgi:hypothetical protein